MRFSSFADELAKIASNSSNRERLVMSAQGDTLPRLLRQQEKLAPIEGSNEPSRLRYLMAKSKGKVPKNDEQDTSLSGGSETVESGTGTPFGGNLLKTGALAGDLRRNGIGGVKRPPFLRMEV